jgi:hypothetical protein
VHGAACSGEHPERDIRVGRDDPVEAGRFYYKHRTTVTTTTGD